MTDNFLCEIVKIKLTYNILNNIHFVTLRSFKENTRRLSFLMRDELVNVQDKAVYWIEHVMRFNGTKHLKPTSQKIPFYQLYLLDVGLLLVLVCLTILGIAVYMVRYIIRCILASLRPFKKITFMSNSKKKD